MSVISSPPVTPVVAPAAAQTRSAGRSISAFAQRYGVLIALVAVMVVLSIKSDTFLTVDNILNMLDQSAVAGLLAVGMTVLMITGSFDLSIGSMLSLCGALALGLAPSVGFVMATVISIVVGAVAGAINGIIVVKVGINSLIVTLGSMSLLQGIVLIYSDGQTIVGDESTTGLQEFANTRSGLPHSAWVTLAIALVMTFVLTSTTSGRYLQASGGNPEAAELAGVKVDRYKVLAFTLMGVLVACGSLLYVGRLGSIDPTAGSGYELDVIAAVIIGGTSLFGGSGSIWRSLVGVILLTVLGNGFNQLDIDPYYQYVVKGLVVILSVAIYTRRVRK